MTGSDMWELIFQDPGPGLVSTAAVLVLGGGWYLLRDLRRRRCQDFTERRHDGRDD